MLAYLATQPENETETHKLDCRSLPDATDSTHVPLSRYKCHLSAGNKTESVPSESEHGQNLSSPRAERLKKSLWKRGCGDGRDQRC